MRIEHLEELVKAQDNTIRLLLEHLYFHAGDHEKMALGNIAASYDDHVRALQYKYTGRQS